MAHRVRKADESDIPDVVETLTESFFDDPIFSWWVPVEGRRKEILPAFFRLVTEAYLPAEEIYRDGDGVAAAVWAPPGLATSEEEMEQFGAAVAEISAEYTDAAFELLGAMEAVHPSDPHFYLFFVGTRPPFQSRGIGSAVMRPVLDGCDRAGIPAYLEATCEENRRLYERHGFVDSGPPIVVRNSPPMFPMWREPTGR